MDESAEFDEGAILHLQLPDGRVITAQIVVSWKPVTMFPVIWLESLQTKKRTPVSFGDETPKQVVLKLHDHRFLRDIRETLRGRTDYTEKDRVEYEDYTASIRSGKVQPIDWGTEWPNRAHRGVNFTHGEEEGAFNYHAKRLHQAEISAYDRLKSLQGTRIPRFYSPISYIKFPHCQRGEPIPGILIELVTGYTLQDFFRAEPPMHQGLVSPVCNDAIKIIHQINECDTLIKDTRLDNILVRYDMVSLDVSTTPPAKYSSTTCAVVGLSHFTFRPEGEDEMDWMERKRIADEAGHVGRQFQEHIETFFLGRKTDRRGGGLWTYKPSVYY